MRQHGLTFNLSWTMLSQPNILNRIVNLIWISARELIFFTNKKLPFEWIPIVNLPSTGIWCNITACVHIFQLIQYSIPCHSYNYFLDRGLLLKRKLQIYGFGLRLLASSNIAIMKIHQNAEINIENVLQSFVLMKAKESIFSFLQGF